MTKGKGKKRQMEPSRTTNKQLEKELFHNSMVESAYKAMSPEERERYKKLGEHLFNDVDFEDTKVINSLPPPMKDSALYILTGIKSGLHPSCLDVNEKLVMSEVYGEKWYEEYGYTEKDLDGF